VYVLLVAPTTSPHDVPSVSQRRHRYVYDVGAFDQPPFVVDRVEPDFSVPEIAGFIVFAGVADVRADAVPAATTTAARIARTAVSRFISTPLGLEGH
jgi:hypothetical protein